VVPSDFGIVRRRGYYRHSGLVQLFSGAGHVLVVTRHGTRSCGIFDRTFAVYSSLVSFFIPLVVMLVADARSIQTLRRNFTLTVVAQSQVPFISSLLKTRNDNEEVRREKRKNEGRERKEEEEKIKNVKRMN